MTESPRIPLTSIHRIDAGGVSVFYPQPGPVDTPITLLLRGFPTYSLAKTMPPFAAALNLRRYAMNVFDYGAPTGFRLRMQRSERVTAAVSQNGNAFVLVSSEMLVSGLSK